MQHPFDNPEIAAASQLRGRTGPVFQALVPAANVECKSKDAPCRPAPGRFCWRVFATGVLLAAQSPATLGCHPHAFGHPPEAIC